MDAGNALRHLDHAELGQTDVMKKRQRQLLLVLQIILKRKFDKNSIINFANSWN